MSADPGAATVDAVNEYERTPVPADASEMGVRDGDELSISSRRGRIRIAARLSDRVARRQVFVPMHYREACVNLLTNPALDPYAGIPEFKVCAVRVEPVAREQVEEAGRAAVPARHS